MSPFVQDANAMVMPVWVFLTAGTNHAVTHFILYHHAHQGKMGHFHLPLSSENTGRVITFIESWPLHAFLSVLQESQQDGSTGRGACCASLEAMRKWKETETPEGCPLTQHMSHSRCNATHGSNNNNSAWGNNIWVIPSATHRNMTVSKNRVTERHPHQALYHIFFKFIFSNNLFSL